MTSKPPRWPSQIQYISSSRYHSSVNLEARAFIQPNGNSSFTDQPSSSRLVSIRPISSSTHPAFGQYGLFAVKKIPPRTHLIDYIGEIHSDDRPASDYDLSLYRSQNGWSVGIDASTMGNEARFINDYRGIQDKPNAVFVDARTASGELRMSIRSSEAIKKGEEILVSYGKAWWSARSDTSL